MKPTLTKILAASGAVLLLAGWGVQAATATPQTDDTANTVTEDTSAAVSMEEAKTIALNDAGVNAEDARFYETKGDYEDGKVVYEIEFVAGNIEYDYEIEKATGKILNKDHEIESENYVRNTQDNTTASNDTAASDKGTAADPSSRAASSASSDNITTANAGITLENAKTIALTNAGFNAADATFVKAKEDRDDGRTVYEIEFYTANGEYDYEIDKTTGKILDIDYDAEAYAPAASNAISINEAKKIALAKVSGASDQHIRIEADHDDGRLVYEGEIHFGRIEYEFEIDGSTGAIIEWDADYDD